MDEVQLNRLKTDPQLLPPGRDIVMMLIREYEFLKSENKRLKEENKAGRQLAHHIRTLPTTELDSDALVMAHRVLGSETP